MHYPLNRIFEYEKPQVIDFQDSLEGNTALHQSIEQTDQEIMKALLRNGANIARHPPVRNSDIYVEMQHQHCPWCDKDKLQKELHKEQNSLTEVSMCQSLTSYAYPKRVLNKEGVYKTVAEDPNTKLVAAVRVSKQHP